MNEVPIRITCTVNLDAVNGTDIPLSDMAEAYRVALMARFPQAVVIVREWQSTGYTPSPEVWTLDDEMQAMPADHTTKDIVSDVIRAAYAARNQP